MLLIFMKAGWCVHKILFFATCPQHSRYNKVLCVCVCLCLCVKCRPVSLPHQHQKFKEDATFFVCFFIPLLNTQFKHDGSILSDSDLFVHDNLQFYFFNFSIFSMYCVIMSI